jgi:hypothetical protein
MDNARWIFGGLVAFAVGILYFLVVDVFLDDLHYRFLWTKGRAYWTRAALGLSSMGFRALAVCKTTISAEARVFAHALPELDAAHGALAVRFDRSRSILGRTALSYERGIRRWGERFLPQAAAGPIHLKPGQQQALAALTADAGSVLTRGEYEKLAGVSRSQAAYDLAELVDAGLIERLGNGRATRYRLARGGGAGQRRWTSDRIRAELEAFCAGREAWPSAKEFKAAGRGDLYVAASRYGGIGYWAGALGLARDERNGSTRNAGEGRRPFGFRTKLAWAGAGALAALGIAVAAGAALITVDRHGTPVASPAAEPSVQGTNGRTADESLHPLLLQAPQTRKPLAQKVQRRHARPSATTNPRPAKERQSTGSSARLISSGTSQTSTPAVSAGRSFEATARAPASWPGPLRAPAGGSDPPPLKAP